MDTARDYKCVSYRWGDLSEIKKSYIVVDGKKFHCSPNVHEILSIYRGAPRDCYWFHRA